MLDLDACPKFGVCVKHQIEQRRGSRARCPPSRLGPAEKARNTASQQVVRAMKRFPVLIFLHLSERSVWALIGTSPPIFRFRCFEPHTRVVCAAGVLANANANANATRSNRTSKPT